MYPSVHAAFVPFNAPFEACVDYLYLDVKGLVSSGLGNLLEPIGCVQRLDFVHPDGRYASQFEIMGSWRRVKQSDLDPLDGGEQYAKLTTIRLTRESLDALIEQKLRSMEANVRIHFRNWASLPADMQLLILCMAWAMGPGFPDKFPKFTAAVNAEEWATAAAECLMDEKDQNDSFHRRNAAHLVLARNAGVVAAQQMDRTKVYYPTVLEG